jgi:hypothetical protein
METIPETEFQVLRTVLRGLTVASGLVYLEMCVYSGVKASQKTTPQRFALYHACVSAERVGVTPTSLAADLGSAYGKT